MHGGYRCNEEGNWDFSSCIPSYCDNEYVFDKISNQCVEDICIKQRKKEINNQKKDKIYLALVITFSVLLLLTIILYVACHYTGKLKKTIYLIILMAIFLILVAVFLILYLPYKEYPLL